MSDDQKTPARVLGNGVVLIGLPERASLEEVPVAQQASTRLVFSPANTNIKPENDFLIRVHLREMEGILAEDYIREVIDERGFHIFPTIRESLEGCAFWNKEKTVILGIRALGEIGLESGTQTEIVATAKEHGLELLDHKTMIALPMHYKGYPFKGVFYIITWRTLMMSGNVFGIQHTGSRVYLGEGVFSPDHKFSKEDRFIFVLPGAPRAQ